jgi:hypothetical protein
LPDSQWQDNPDLARSVIREGLAILKAAAGVVKELIGDLSVLSEEESWETRLVPLPDQGVWHPEDPQATALPGRLRPPGEREVVRGEPDPRHDGAFAPRH